MTTCEHAAAKHCPIGKSVCPGVCLYAEILDNINIGIIVFDLTNRQIVFRNGLFIEMFKDLTLEDDYKSLFELLLMKNSSYMSVSPYSPEPILLGDRIFGFTIYRIMENFVWIFIRDITEKIRLESIAEAVNSSTNIGYIFSGVRHEIGNPINSIKTALSVLRTNFDNFSKENILKYIDRTLDDIGRVEYLLKSLKNFNMYESPKLQNVSLPLFMERFLSLVEDVKNKGIRVEHVLYQGAEWGYSDPRALQQVMLNIITNAADALENTENPYITITLFKNRNNIEIIIEDNGCGLSEEAQKDLFKPFFTSKQKGTGLGLIIARKMLASMNSTLFIESYKDLGTIVHISIPEGRVNP